MKEYFKINASKYDSSKHYSVVRPSSLNNPKDYSVMFVTEGYIDKVDVLKTINDCIIIWPKNYPVPEELRDIHTFILSEEPRRDFALFFKENHVTYNEKPKAFDVVNGAYICKGAMIGEGTDVFPGAYIDADVEIGKNCYIGSGVRLIGHIRIGNDVIIRENTVLGSDGLTRMRDDEGHVATTPQFGGVRIEDNVQIGANSVICKGAIDDTVIYSGCRIDNETFISHNVQMAEDTVVVGETIMMGSSSTGKRAFISGNSTIRDGAHVGEDAFVAMGANVVKDVADKAVVKGNPAK